MPKRVQKAGRVFAHACLFDMRLNFCKLLMGKFPNLLHMIPCSAPGLTYRLYAKRLLKRRDRRIFFPRLLVA